MLTNPLPTSATATAAIKPLQIIKSCLYLHGDKVVRYTGDKSRNGALIVRHHNETPYGVKASSLSRADETARNAYFGR